MARHNVKNFVFSSSATGASLALSLSLSAPPLRLIVSPSLVYGEPDTLPITENAVLKRPTNAYGRTKFFIEEIVRDICEADATWNVTLLRYFNPVGAFPQLCCGCSSLW